MKKLIFGLITLVFLTSCKKSKNIYDLKEFCDYTINCYKNDNISEAINLRVTKDKLMSTISSMTMPEPNKKRELEATEKRAENGYFDKAKLEEAYSIFRGKEKDDFWKECSIEKYEYMTSEDFFGFQMAEPIITLNHGNKTVRFKVGELIKTDEGWRILYGGPNWK